MFTGNKSQYLLDPAGRQKAPNASGKRDGRRDKGYVNECANLLWKLSQAETSLKIKRVVRKSVAVKINREWMENSIPFNEYKTSPHLIYTSI